ncbi:hypothetical protein LO772_32380 [Yinghuangia sp. ASG 101]|uniref:hypothetical protein n=1 Tax=Yinghuangia sp. ASG 101 TaxID=2896848 RepID=UPI001E3ECB66|nr:hypothetical protein [Yinghuangia sp. ASG 101]UGQ11435.1 hypothetical protein LO772_32380 [Yinghuangia sp. ASG 101]
MELTKWLMHDAWSSTPEQQLRDEASALQLSSRSRDFREGMASFAAKRRADFRGR